MQGNYFLHHISAIQFQYEKDKMSTYKMSFFWYMFPDFFYKMSFLYCGFSYWIWIFISEMKGIFGNLKLYWVQVQKDWA